MRGARTELILPAGRANAQPAERLQPRPCDANRNHCSDTVLVCCPAEVLPPPHSPAQMTAPAAPLEPFLLRRSNSRRSRKMSGTAAPIGCSAKYGARNSQCLRSGKSLPGQAWKLTSMMLHCMHGDRPMKTTIAIDDDLFAKAQEFASVTEQSAVIREALKAFVERGRTQAGSHGGELPSAVAPQRRRQRRNPG